MRSTSSTAVLASGLRWFARETPFEDGAWRCGRRAGAALCKIRREDSGKLCALRGRGRTRQQAQEHPLDEMRDGLLLHRERGECGRDDLSLRGHRQIVLRSDRKARWAAVARAALHRDQLGGEAIHRLVVEQRLADPPAERPRVVQGAPKDVRFFASTSCQ